MALLQTAVLQPGCGNALVVRTTAPLQIRGAVQPGGGLYSFAVYALGPSDCATRVAAITASDATPSHRPLLLRTVARMQADTRAAESIS